MRFALPLMLMFSACVGPSLVCAQDPNEPEGISTREAKQQAIRGVPFQRLQPQVGNEIRDVLENPSFFRRMPTQQIACDPQMFTFLVRRPEVMVNIWELMGITKVKAQRTSPFTFLADDGVGTACRCDLIYSDGNLHMYLGNGTYDGSMSPRKVTGRCVCILRTENRAGAAGDPNIAGTMDVFLKLDNLGADLLTRTIGPFVGKTADYNFVETAKFISQISQICQMNPAAAQALASKLDKVDEGTRREFAEIVTRIASAGADLAAERNVYVDTNLQPPRQETTVVPPDYRAEGTSQPFSNQLSESMLETSPPNQLRLTDRLPPESEAAKLQAMPPDAMATPPAAIVPAKPNIYMRR